MHRHSTLLLTALAASSALALSACGSSGSDSGSTNASASSTATAGASGSGRATDRAAAGKVVTIRLSEFKIAPRNGAVKAGARTLRIVNSGDMEHALTISKAGPHGKDITTGDIAPGATKTIAVRLEKGRYTWFCPVGNHRMMGMVGTLVVG